MSVRHIKKAAKEPLRGRADLDRLDRMTEEEIARTSPQELADLPADFWDQARVVTPEPKEAISLRVDRDVLAWFRDGGPRYQTRMNAVLRSYMKAMMTGERQGALRLGERARTAPSRGRPNTGEDGTTTLRCTSRLLKRLGQIPDPDLRPPTSRLGDWYANLLNVQRHRLVICTNERTLLTVIVPIRDPARLRERIRDATGDLLASLGAAPHMISPEIAGMAAMPVGPTASRSVLGSMNDFVYQSKQYFHAARETVCLSELALWLAETPCGPLDYRTPAEAAHSALDVA